MADQERIRNGLVTEWHRLQCDPTVLIASSERIKQELGWSANLLSVHGLL
jgi:UDP-glucose 4-epimerase